MKKNDVDQITQLNILFGIEQGAEIRPVTHEHNNVGQHKGRNTANDLTRQIIRFIQRHGGQAERIAVTGLLRKFGNGYKWTRTNMTVGTADISATIQGRSVKIEVKIGTDRQSDEQKRYQKQVEDAGGIYYIARTFEEFLKWYNSLWGTATIKG